MFGWFRSDKSPRSANPNDEHSRHPMVDPTPLPVPGEVETFAQDVLGTHLSPLWDDVLNARNRNRPDVSETFCRLLSAFLEGYGTRAEASKVFADVYAQFLALTNKEFNDDQVEDEEIMPPPLSPLRSRYIAPFDAPVAAAATAGKSIPKPARQVEHVAGHPSEFVMMLYVRMRQLFDDARTSSRCHDGGSVPPMYANPTDCVNNEELLAAQRQVRKEFCLCVESLALAVYWPSNMHALQSHIGSDLAAYVTAAGCILVEQLRTVISESFPSSFFPVDDRNADESDEKTIELSMETVEFLLHVHQSLVHMMAHSATPAPLQFQDFLPSQPWTAEEARLFECEDESLLHTYYKGNFGHETNFSKGRLVLNPRMVTNKAALFEGLLRAGGGEYLQGLWSVLQMLQSRLTGINSSNVERFTVLIGILEAELLAVVVQVLSMSPLLLTTSWWQAFSLPQIVAKLVKVPLHVNPTASQRILSARGALQVRKFLLILRINTLLEFHIERTVHNPTPASSGAMNGSQSVSFSGSFKRDQSGATTMEEWQRLTLTPHESASILVWMARNLSSIAMHGEWFHNVSDPKRNCVVFEYSRNVGMVSIGHDFWPWKTSSAMQTQAQMSSTIGMSPSEAAAAQFVFDEDILQDIGDSSIGSADSFIEQSNHSNTDFHLLPKEQLGQLQRGLYSDPIYALWDAAVCEILGSRMLSRTLPSSLGGSKVSLKRVKLVALVFQQLFHLFTTIQANELSQDESTEVSIESLVPFAQLQFLDFISQVVKAAEATEVFGMLIELEVFSLFFSQHFLLGHATSLQRLESLFDVVDVNEKHEGSFAKFHVECRDLKKTNDAVLIPWLMVHCGALNYLHGLIIYSLYFQSDMSLDDTSGSTPGGHGSSSSSGDTTSYLTHEEISLAMAEHTIRVCREHVYPHLVFQLALVLMNVSDVARSPAAAQTEVRDLLLATLLELLNLVAREKNSVIASGKTLAAQVPPDFLTVISNLEDGNSPKPTAYTVGESHLLNAATSALSTLVLVLVNTATHSFLSEPQRSPIQSNDWLLVFLRDEDHALVDFSTEFPCQLVVHPRRGISIARQSARRISHPSATVNDVERCCRLRPTLQFLLPLLLDVELHAVALHFVQLIVLGCATQAMHMEGRLPPALTPADARFIGSRPEHNNATQLMSPLSSTWSSSFMSPGSISSIPTDPSVSSGAENMSVQRPRDWKSETRKLAAEVIRVIFHFTSVAHKYPDAQHSVSIARRGIDALIHLVRAERWSLFHSAIQEFVRRENIFYECLKSLARTLNGFDVLRNLCLSTASNNASTEVVQSNESKEISDVSSLASASALRFHVLLTKLLHTGLSFLTAYTVGNESAKNSLNLLMQANRDKVGNSKLRHNSQGRVVPAASGLSSLILCGQESPSRETLVVFLDMILDGISAGRSYCSDILRCSSSGNGSSSISARHSYTSQHGKYGNSQTIASNSSFVLFSGDIDRPPISNSALLIDFFHLLPYCSEATQQFAVESFCNLISGRASLVNLNVCAASRPKILDVALDLLPHLSDSIQSCASELIELLGRHSISVASLKHLFRVLQQTDGSLRSPWSWKIIQSLQGMFQQESGPKHTFVFDGRQSGLVLPPIYKWPTAMKGFSFCCWLRLESRHSREIFKGYHSDRVSSNSSRGGGESDSEGGERDALVFDEIHNPYLFCFRDASGTGLEVYFKRINEAGEFRIVIRSYSDIGETSTLCPESEAMKVQEDRWYFFGVSLTPTTLFSRGEALVLFNKQVARHEFNFNRLPDNIPTPLIGECPEDIRLDSLHTTFQGQLGAIYFFSDALSDFQLRSIQSLGPDYVYNFEPLSGSTPNGNGSRRSGHYSSNTTGNSNQVKILEDGVLTSRILLAYNPVVLKDRYFLDNTPEKNELKWRIPANHVSSLAYELRGAGEGGKTCRMHARRLTGTHRSTTQDVRLALNSLGGIKALIPLFAQIDQANSNITSEDKLNGDHPQPVSSLSDPQGSNSNRSSADTNFFPAVLGLFTTMIEDSTDNHKHFQRCGGFAAIRSLLERAALHNFNLITFNQWAAIYFKLHENRVLQESCLDNVLCNFSLWSRTPADVQLCLLSFLLQTFGGSENSDPQVSPVYSHGSLPTALSVGRLLDAMIQFYDYAPSTIFSVATNTLVSTTTSEELNIASGELVSPLPADEPPDNSTPELKVSLASLSHSAMVTVRQRIFALIRLGIHRRPSLHPDNVAALVRYLSTASTDLARIETLRFLLSLVSDSTSFVGEKRSAILLGLSIWGAPLTLFESVHRLGNAEVRRLITLLSFTTLRSLATNVVEVSEFYSSLSDYRSPTDDMTTTNGGSISENKQMNSREEIRNMLSSPATSLIKVRSPSEFFERSGLTCQSTRFLNYLMDHEALMSLSSEDHFVSSGAIGITTIIRSIFALATGISLSFFVDEMVEKIPCLSVAQPYIPTIRFSVLSGTASVPAIGGCSSSDRGDAGLTADAYSAAPLSFLFIVQLRLLSLKSNLTLSDRLAYISRADRLLSATSYSRIVGIYGISDAVATIGARIASLVASHLSAEDAAPEDARDAVAMSPPGTTVELALAAANKLQASAVKINSSVERDARSSILKRFTCLVSNIASFAIRCGSPDVEATTPVGPVEGLSTQAQSDRFAVPFTAQCIWDSQVESGACQPGMMTVHLLLDALSRHLGNLSRDFLSAVTHAILSVSTVTLKMLTQSFFIDMNLSTHSSESVNQGSVTPSSGQSSGAAACEGCSYLHVTNHGNESAFRFTHSRNLHILSLLLRDFSSRLESESKLFHSDENQSLDHDLEVIYEDRLPLSRLFPLRPISEIIEVSRLQSTVRDNIPTLFLLPVDISSPTYVLKVLARNEWYSQFDSSPNGVRSNIASIPAILGLWGTIRLFVDFCWSIPTHELFVTAEVFNVVEFESPIFSAPVPTVDSIVSSELGVVSQWHLFWQRDCESTLCSLPCLMLRLLYAFTSLVWKHTGDQTAVGLIMMYIGEAVVSLTVNHGQHEVFTFEMVSFIANLSYMMTHPVRPFNCISSSNDIVFTPPPILQSLLRRFIAASSSFLSELIDSFILNIDNSTNNSDEERLRTIVSLLGSHVRVSRCREFFTYNRRFSNEETKLSEVADDNWNFLLSELRRLLGRSLNSSHLATGSNDSTAKCGKQVWRDLTCFLLDFSAFMESEFTPVRSMELGIGLLHALLYNHSSITSSLESSLRQQRIMSRGMSITMDQEIFAPQKDCAYLSLVSELEAARMTEFARHSANAARRAEMKWSRIFSLLANERGPWGYGAEAVREVFWSLDSVISNQNLRLRMRRNPHGSRHLIASLKALGKESVEEQAAVQAAIEGGDRLGSGIYADLRKYKKLRTEGFSGEDSDDDDVPTSTTPQADLPGIESVGEQPPALTASASSGNLVALNPRSGSKSADSLSASIALSSANGFYDYEAELYEDWAAALEGVHADADSLVLPVEVVTLATNSSGGRTLGRLELSRHKIAFKRAVESKDFDFQNRTGNTEFLWATKCFPSTVWLGSEVVAVYRRHFQLRFVALELVFTSRTSVFFNLLDKTSAKRAYNFIETRLRAPNLRNLIRGRPMENIKRVFSNDGLTIQQAWVMRKISNFDYLLYLNHIAGRSFNDLAQYPVMPWILSDYTSAKLDLRDPRVYRNFRLPIGAQLESQRILMQEKYESCLQLADDGIFPYHTGSHYSTSAMVLWYLMRLEPFTSLHVWLQDGKFDRPDRLFHSIEAAYVGCTTNTQDVKELIPEFFCSPEFLYNSNGCDYGSRQNGQRIHDVTLPKWAKDATEFVRIHRDALESEFVSNQLHHWIDLIFGYKQRPPFLPNGSEEAVDVFNVFVHLSYVDAVDLDSLKSSDPVLYNRTIRQIDSYGQTPCQLFTTPHPRRKSLEEMHELVWPLASCVLGADTILRSRVKNANPPPPPIPGSTSQFNSNPELNPDVVPGVIPANDSLLRPSRVLCYGEFKISNNPILFIVETGDRILTIDSARILGSHQFVLRQPDNVPPFTIKLDKSATTYALSSGSGSSSGGSSGSGSGFFSASSKEKVIGIPFAAPVVLSSNIINRTGMHQAEFAAELIGTPANKAHFWEEETAAKERIEAVKRRKSLARSGRGAQNSVQTRNAPASDSPLSLDTRPNSVRTEHYGDSTSAPTMRLPIQRRDRVDDHLSPHLFCYIPVARLIASCGHWDNTLKLTSADTGRLVQSLTYHREVITCIATASDYNKHWIVVGSKDCTLTIWELSPERDNEPLNSAPTHTLYGHDDAVNCVALHAELDLVVSGSDDGTIIVHTLREGQYVRSITFGVVVPPSMPPPPSTAAAAAAAAALNGGSIPPSSPIKPQSTEVSTAGPSAHFSITQLDKTTRRIHLIAIANDGAIIAFSNDDWVLGSYTLNGRLQKLVNVRERLHCILISEDGKVVLTGGERGLVVLRWCHNLQIANNGPRRGLDSIIDGSNSVNIYPFSSPIRSLLLTSQERLLIVGLESGEMRILAQDSEYLRRKLHRRLMEIGILSM